MNKMSLRRTPLYLELSDRLQASLRRAYLSSAVWLVSFPTATFALMVVTGQEAGKLARRATPARHTTRWHHVKRILYPGSLPSGPRAGSGFPVLLFVYFTAELDPRSSQSPINRRQSLP